MTAMLQQRLQDSHCYLAMPFERLHVREFLIFVSERARFQTPVIRRSLQPAAKNDTSPCRSPSGMTSHADTAPERALLIRATPPWLPAPFENLRAYLGQAQRPLPSHATRQTGSPIYAAGAPIHRGHKTSQPGPPLQLRSPMSDASQTAFFMARLRLLAAKRRPVSKILRSRSTRLQRSIEGNTSVAAHVVVPAPHPGQAANAAPSHSLVSRLPETLADSLHR